MRLVAIRRHNDIRFYGYLGDDGQVYWSMRDYREWHAPMLVD